MSKKKWSLLLAIFFLVQSISSSLALSFESSLLNPPTNIDANYSDGVVKKIYDAICLGISLYQLDAIGRSSGPDIEKSYAALALNSEARFDLANMGMGKRGWTRHYPFSVGNRAFIMRIFLTAERAYQSAEAVLYEGAINDPAVTFQILPSINDIISSCKIKPHSTYSSSEVNQGA